MSASALLENEMSKQREEFEKAFKEKLGAHGCQFDLDDDGNYEDRETLCGWFMWQQAQKVAVSDGSVNLNKFDILRKMHNIRDLNNGEYYSDEIEENICAVEATIEAQEN